MIGIDILETQRMEKFLNNKDLLKSVFYQSEIEYFENFSNPIERITGCFCAKEAVLKALECPSRVSVKDIEIKHKSNGKPYAVLHKNAEKYKEKNIDISISHSKTIAAAICEIK